MLLKGKYNHAKVFNKNIDGLTRRQIENYLDMDYCEGEQVRIMPDTHAGKGSVIGFTQTFSDKVCVNIVGVDIDCGMLTVELGRDEMDLKKLDKVIHREIPAGFNVRDSVAVPFMEELESMKMAHALKDLNRLERSIGTLGGGNHFIEVAEDDAGIKYLVIHTGSRNLGTQVAEHYQQIAIDKRSSDYPRDLCYIEGEDLENYLHDMEIAGKFATLNRRTIASVILSKMFGRELEEFKYFETTHNYIDLEKNMIRKGAISAQKDELVLIPLNMRDGSLICRGKGNPDWNYSAPHGAGRVLSRNQARRQLCLKDFKRAMRGIHTSSVVGSTLDEAPAAYRDPEEIISLIGDTVEIVKHIRPIYNFKAK